jgi:hypothetical protein
VNLSTQDQTDIKTPLLLDFKTCNDEINATLCYQMLQNLLPRSRKSVTVTPTHSIILLHNIAHPHVVHRVQDQVSAMLWEVLKYPVYSQGLLLYNFTIFGPLKTALKTLTFIPDNNVLETVLHWFRQQVKEFFTNGINRLVHQ